MVEQPKVIFFDAVGTLFGVKGSVGQVYVPIAARYGVEVAAPTLDHAFIKAFQAARSPAFPAADPVAIPELEYDWWREVAIATFNEAEVLMLFDDFDAFFQDLFQHFATAEPWEIYPDTISTLQQLQQAEITLGLISNFDSRLYAVLKALDLAQFFESVTISTEAGAAKPDTAIFQTALAKHSCNSAQAWHIGDSLSEDYRAACAIGMRGIWLQRA